MKERIIFTVLMREFSDVSSARYQDICNKIINNHGYLFEKYPAIDNDNSPEYSQLYACITGAIQEELENRD